MTIALITISGILFTRQMWNLSVTRGRHRRPGSRLVSTARGRHAKG